MESRQESESEGWEGGGGAEKGPIEGEKECCE